MNLFNQYKYFAKNVIRVSLSFASGDPGSKKTRTIEFLSMVLCLKVLDSLFLRMEVRSSKLDANFVSMRNPFGIRHEEDHRLMSSLPR